MTEQAATLTPQVTVIRYGWHDRFKIPLDHPSALSFYLDNLFVPHSRREMLWAAVARASAPAGSAMLPLLGLTAADRLKGRGRAPDGGRDGADGAGSDARAERLVARLREAGVPVGDTPSVITLDDYRHSERGKMVIFLLDRGASKPCVVAKASGDPEHGAALGREHAALLSLHGRLDEELRATLPLPLAAVEEGGLMTFAEAYMPGRSMYFEMRNSWLPRRRAEGHFRIARNWLVRFQKATRVGEAQLGGQLSDEHVVQPLREYQRLCSPAAAERKFIAEVMRKAQSVKHERLPVVAGQGDFWARNLILNGGGLGVLDWENYGERGTPFSDLFLFTTSYGLSYSWRIGRWAEPVIAFRATYTGEGWMARLVRKQLLAYCAATGVSPKLLEVFFPAFLAGRALEERSRRGRNGSRRGAVRGAGQGGGREVISEGGGTWGRLFQEYARLEGRVCFGS